MRELLLLLVFLCVQGTSWTAEQQDTKAGRQRPDSVRLRYGVRSSSSEEPLQQQPTSQTLSPQSGQYGATVVGGARVVTLRNGLRALVRSDADLSEQDLGQQTVRSRPIGVSGPQATYQDPVTTFPGYQDDSLYGPPRRLPYNPVNSYPGYQEGGLYGLPRGQPFFRDRYFQNSYVQDPYYDDRVLDPYYYRQQNPSLSGDYPLDPYAYGRPRYQPYIPNPYFRDLYQPEYYDRGTYDDYYSGYARQPFGRYGNDYGRYNRGYGLESYPRISTYPRAVGGNVYPQGYLNRVQGQLPQDSYPRISTYPRAVGGNVYPQGYLNGVQGQLPQDSYPRTSTYPRSVQGQIGFGNVYPQGQANGLQGQLPQDSYPRISSYPRSIQDQIVIGDNAYAQGQQSALQQQVYTQDSATQSQTVA